MAVPRSGREGRDASSIALRLHNLDNIPVVTASFRGGQDFFVFTCACNVCSQTVDILGCVRFSAALSFLCGDGQSLPAGGARLTVWPAQLACLSCSPIQGFTDEWPYWSHISVGVGAQRSCLYTFLGSASSTEPLLYLRIYFSSYTEFFFLFSHRSSFGCMFIGFCNNVS